MNFPRSPLTAALWSVAIPGFGQLYNHKYLKGVIFIILEFIINFYSKLNSAIYYSWLFDISQAQRVINYEWLLFYPCMYVFAIFDAYHDCSMEVGKPYSRFMFIPFIGTGFLGTIGVIWSSGEASFFGLEKIGPVFFGTVVLLIGLGLGSWTANRFFPRQ